MKDVGDGKKVSIQDGVEEDPEFEERFILTGKSGLGLIYLLTTYTNPKIETVVSVETVTPMAIGTIEAVVGLVVT